MMEREGWVMEREGRVEREGSDREGGVSDG